jgi:DNA-binding response OmpR family regulator
MSRVLVVDDVAAVRDMVVRLLVEVGYEVHAVSDGEAALAEALTGKYDLLILDIRLPKIDGIEVCRRIRLQSEIPVLMLTGLGKATDKVMGLEMGADDYLTKPFSALELLARVKALLRRSGTQRGTDRVTQRDPQNASPWRVEMDGVTLDMIEREVVKDGRAIRLTPKEFDLLAYLARNQGTTFSSRQLMADVWGYPDSSDTRTVAVHIRWLREKLEADPAKPTLIRTAKGSGYHIGPQPR